MADPPSSPHDALFKRTFGVPQHAAAELRAVLPPSLVSRIDWSTLHPCSETFVDVALVDSHTDLLFSVNLSGRPALLYVLFEHQSTVDQLMPWRLLGYVVSVIDKHLRDRRENGDSSLPLPVVIPVLLHHSDSGWTARRDVHDLFDHELLQLPEIAQVVPRMGFFIDDISQLSDDDLRRRVLGHVPTLTLWALRDARRGRRVLVSLGRVAGLLDELLSAPDGFEAFMAIFRYIFKVADAATSRKVRTVIQKMLPEAKGALMTLAEQLKAEGKAEGRAEGELRGRAEGELRGRAELLLRQMALRFGPLPEADRERVLTASRAELDRWAEAVLSASSLAEMMDR